MNKALILLCFLISITSFSQISVGPTHVGKQKKFEDGQLEKFKKTTTLFVLPNTIDRNKYNELLKSSWTVTPYEIVDHDGFKIENYLNGKYSIADLKTIGYLSRNGYYSLHVFLDIKILNEPAILEKIEKFSSKKWEKKKDEIIQKNSFDIARFYIYPKGKFQEKNVRIGNIKVPGAMFDDEHFYNFKPGYLKNYFQKVNNLLKDENTYWMYEDDHLQELNVLANNKLYIPSYMDGDFNGFAGENVKSEEEVFNQYKFEYEIIDNNLLNEMILKEKNIYYLRFVKVNTQRFLQIVNAESGEIVYRNYIHGNSHKTKSKHIDRLNETISEASR